MKLPGPTRPPPKRIRPRDHGGSASKRRHFEGAPAGLGRQDCGDRIAPPGYPHTVFHTRIRMFIAVRSSRYSVPYAVFRITKVSTPLAEVDDTSSLRVA
jgi:hypothetical protein